MKRYLMAAAILLFSQLSVAEDLLKLDTLSVGDKPSYGKYLVKSQNGFLSGEPNAIDNGSIEFDTSFSGNFAMTAEYAFDRGAEIRLTAEGYEIKLEGNGNGFRVYVNGSRAKDTVTGDYFGAGDWAGSKLVPESEFHGKVKLTIINNTLKTFDAKDRPMGTTQLKENVTYTKLIVSGIRPIDSLVSLNVLGDTATVNPGTGTGGTGTTCPTLPTGGTANAGTPTLGANLNMTIPSLSYQTLGGNMNLWAELQFQPTNDGKFWWTLTNYGVNQ